MLPPVDQITPWWSGLNQQTFNAAWAWSNDVQIDRGNTGKAANNSNLNQPWLGDAMGGITGGGVGFFYVNGNPTASIIRQTDAVTNFGLNSAGAIDRSISSFPFGRLQSVAGYNDYSKNAEADANARGVTNPFPAASKNFYKDVHLQDPGVFDFYNNLIDGDNKWEYSDWDAFNISLSQTFWNNRVGFEFVYDFQDYESGNYSLLGWRPSIGVDVNTHTNMIPVTYPNAVPGTVPDPTTVQGGDPNPFVGHAYVSGGRPGASSTETQLDNYRLTAFAELRGSDFFNDDSLLAKLIGRNVFTGLLSRSERSSFDKGWLAFAAEEDFALMQDRTAKVDGWERGFSYAVYLSDDLRGVSSPWNLNLPRVQTRVNPSGTYSVQFFDSHWNAPGVDPAAAYILPHNGEASTQSENWQNYVGYGPTDVRILNAEAGDKADLTTTAAKADQVLDSYGVTWQGYLLNGMAVPTVGWRHDEVENWGASGAIDPDTGVRSTDFDNPKIEGETAISSGETVTWGIVGHTDQWLANRLPGGTNVSFFYNKSENFRAANRVGFSGTKLPAPIGESEDYGFVLNTLDDRLSFKVNWYKTTVENANIGSSSPLGGNTWFLNLVEAWGTALAVATERYWKGDLPGLSGTANPGLVAENKWGAEGWENAPFSDEAYNHPENIRARAFYEDWFATMPDQSYFDAYGLPINVAKIQGSYADRLTGIDNGNWNPYSGIGSIQSTGGGRVFGLWPTMTINQESEGVEFEVQYRPVRNWNITVNAAKTTATRTDLGEEIVNWINYQYERFQGPAGDMRFWWACDGQRTRDYYQQFIYEPYLFQLEANGQSAPEIRPWRFNLITNYSFEDGRLAGMNVGGAVRWQDDVILGYNLDSTKTKLDVTNPIYGGSETNIDFWVGYGKKLSDSLDWRIQVNVRNVGKDYELIPVSMNPDGSMAVGRISEGMTWEITNTFNF